MFVGALAATSGAVDAVRAQPAALVLKRFSGTDGATLTPPAAGQTAWTYAVIHNFDFHDGAGPPGSLVSSSAGKIYGTASEAGAHGHGHVRADAARHRQ